MPDGVVQRVLPTAMPDNSNVQVSGRRGRYGESSVAVMNEWRRALAEEGSYYTAYNPTLGTGVVRVVATAFSDTITHWLVQNTDLPSNAVGKSVYLDYLRLIIMATIPTGSITQLNFALRKGTTNRLSTTAAQQTEADVTNMRKASGRTSVARVWGSNAQATSITSPASVAGTDFLVGRGVIPIGQAVVGDEYNLAFGANPGDFTFQGGAAARATDPAKRGTHMPPVVVDPGEWLAVHMWLPNEATNGLTYEWELALYER